MAETWPPSDTHHRRFMAGFTLIELLVAISLLALMSVLTWRGVDGISRSQIQLQQHSDEVQTLQATLGQWAADLDALAEQPNWSSLQWDGQSLRLLRRGTASGGDGLRVVAWVRRGVGGVGQWLRWQSEALTTRSDMEAAWQQAQVWAKTPVEDEQRREVVTIALDDWQIYFYRGNAWTNPLSSAGTVPSVAVAAVPATAASGAVSTPAGAAVVAPVTAQPDALPDGVRLVLKLPEGHGISGTLTRDWVRPVLGGAP